LDDLETGRRDLLRQASVDRRGAPRPPPFVYFVNPGSVVIWAAHQGRGIYAASTFTIRKE